MQFYQLTYYFLALFILVSFYFVGRGYHFLFKLKYNAELTHFSVFSNFAATRWIAGVFHDPGPCQKRAGAANWPPCTPPRRVFRATGSRCLTGRAGRPAACY